MPIRVTLLALLMVIVISCYHASALSGDSQNVLEIANDVLPEFRELPKHLLGSDEGQGSPAKTASRGHEVSAPEDAPLKPRNLPTHLSGTIKKDQVSLRVKRATSDSVNRQDFVRKPALKDSAQHSSRKITENNFWKPWKPHGFGQLSAKDCAAGDPLILTPFIRNGKIDEAQKLARVRLPGFDQESYSGYFTVNQSDSSNTFFWFFPAQVAVPEDAPVLVWLQGGPGATSMFGLFDEHGPFYLTADLSLKPRDFSWNLIANVIYIDNPVGTGFSFTKTDAGYARNEDQVGKNLYEALLQFYELFPKYQKGDLYLSGESYAGKYVPALGYTIHVNNPKAELKLPFKGVAIGNGFVDPYNMLDFGNLLYNTGLADRQEADYLVNQTILIQKAIEEGRFRDAFALEDRLMDGDLWKYPTYFYNITGSTYYYNFLQSKDPQGFAYYWQYVNQCYIRKALHVGNQIFDGGLKVEQFLLDDIFQTAKEYLVPLLENYRVLIYNGQLDLICALPLTENYLEKLQWKGSEEYKKSVKYVWKVDDADVEPAGYVRRVGEFYQVAVRKGDTLVVFSCVASEQCFEQCFDNGEKGGSIIQTFTFLEMSSNVSASNSSRSERQGDGLRD